MLIGPSFITSNDLKAYIYSGSKLLGFKFLPCHTPAMGTWTNYLTSLCLGVLVGKMGFIITPTLWGFVSGEIILIIIDV